MNDIKSIVVKLKYRQQQKQIAKEYFRDFIPVIHDCLYYQNQVYILYRSLFIISQCKNYRCYRIYNFKKRIYVCELSKNY